MALMRFAVLYVTRFAHGADWIKIYADRSYSKLPDGSYRSLTNFTTEEIMAVVYEVKRRIENSAAHVVKSRDGILAISRRTIH
jgi:hypothetical protein